MSDQATDTENEDVRADEAANPEIDVSDVPLPDEVPQQEASDATDEPDGDHGEAEPPEKPGGVQLRIDELTRRLRDAEREAAYYRGISAAKQPEQKQEAPAPAPEPQMDDFEDVGSYLKALAKWEANQIADERISRLNRENEEAERKAAADRQVREFRERTQSFLKDGKAKYGDFDVVMQSPDLPISPAMRDAMLVADNGVDVAYHLATNPDEARSIFDLQPFQQIQQIGILAHRLSTPQDQPSTSAPPPPRTLKGSGGGSRNPEAESESQYMERRRKEWLRAKGLAPSS